MYKWWWREEWECACVNEWRREEMENQSVSLEFCFIFKNRNTQKAIFCYSSYLACFGGGNGCDFYLSDQCNVNSSSSSDFGHSYELPEGYSADTPQAQSYLAGSDEFQVSEIEVFQVE